MEIDEFKPQEYWSVEVEFNKNGQSIPISSHLTHLNSKKLTQFSITSDKVAEDIKSKISSSKFKVLDSKKSTIRKMPPSPYITSTLQQDAANKLQFSAAYTMKLAQKLYEGVVLPDGRATGLITYTRTDGLHLSDQAANDIHALVKERYGESFASETPRKYFKKVKNAQEAHEAIRPTDIWKIPDNLVKILDEDSLKLYTLIWSRTVACQMEPSLTEILQIDIGDSEKSIFLRSSCSKIAFLGFRAAYEDQVNEGQDRTNSVFEVLDELKKGDPLSMQKVEPKQHHTQPPGRYSEASLVKKLEELGIGRPSTYASTIKVLQDRNYVTVKSRVLHPEFRGRMLSAFLSHHFTEVTDYSFTADMETELDNISAGLTGWKGLLSDYWTRFSKYCELASQVHIHQVEKMLEKTFEDTIFACLPNKDNRVCPSCREGTLIFKVSKLGAGHFIGCDKYPTCKYIAKTMYGDKEEDEPFEHNSIEEPKVLGLNPGSEDKILMKYGPYGYYVQFGVDRKGYNAKRVSLNHVKTPDRVTLEDALELLRYPITLGAHPVDGKAVIIRLAKLGFSIKHSGTNALIPKDMNPRDVTFEIALKLLSGTGKDVTHSGRKIERGAVKVEEEAY
jgi:DNA topoisomerase I